MKKYAVYIVACADHSFYTGITNSVSQRVEEHNLGIDQKAYTYNRRPVRLEWFQEFLNPKEAIQREKQIKGWSRSKKKALIAKEYDKLPILSQNTSLRQAQIDMKDILDKLPYAPPFLFVDSLSEISEEKVVGSYTFPKDAYYYQGHFKHMSVTPGVLLTECCAQIGLVCLGIHLLGNTLDSSITIGFTSSDMEFLIPVFPGETVSVHSEKSYFRFQKLKCKVRMKNSRGEIVCKGTLAGMFKAEQDEA